MEKSNVINIIVSCLLIIVGIAFWYVTWRESKENQEWMFLTGGVLIIYGIVRCVISNHVTKQ